MYNVIKSVIERGGFELSDMLDRIKQSYIMGDITGKQCQEFMILAQSKAKPENDTDVIQKIISLEKRILKLEEQLATGGNVSPDEPPEGNDITYDAFVSGRWYYGGDKISFDGKNYECTAPEGSVCVWNPKDYPAYWTVIE